MSLRTREFLLAARNDLRDDREAVTRRSFREDRAVSALLGLKYPSVGIAIALGLVRIGFPRMAALVPLYPVLALLVLPSHSPRCFWRSSLLTGAVAWPGRKVSIEDRRTLFLSCLEPCLRSWNRSGYGRKREAPRARYIVGIVRVVTNAKEVLRARTREPLLCGVRSIGWKSPPVANSQRKLSVLAAACLELPINS